MVDGSFLVSKWILKVLIKDEWRDQIITYLDTNQTIDAKEMSSRSLARLDPSSWNHSDSREQTEY